MPTVDELRDEIREATGRYERIESTAFTKEALAAICEAVGHDVDANQLPSKAQMRAGILWKLRELDEDDPDLVDSPFRKAQLQTVAEALRGEQ